jgi:hypothetical protein
MGEWYYTQMRSRSYARSSQLLRSRELTSYASFTFCVPYHSPIIALVSFRRKNRIEVPPAPQFYFSPNNKIGQKLSALSCQREAKQLMLRPSLDSSHEKIEAQTSIIRRSMPQFFRGMGRQLLPPHVFFEL